MKEIIKTTILFLHALTHRNKTGKIIYYHDVYSKIKYTDMGTSLELFEKHIKLIQEQGYIIVNRLPNNDHEINICFDDGWRGIWDNKEFFLKYNIKPTVFLAYNLIGKEGYLTWNEIIELQNIGFNFQSHTCSHCILSELTEEELQYELSESKRLLSEKLNNTIDAICFPCGMYSDLVLRLSYNSGYKYLYSSVPGCVREGDILLRRNLVQDSSEFRFKQILNGGLSVLTKKALNYHYKNK